MAVSRPRLAALLVSVLFLAAEIFAYAPQLHANCSTAAGLSPGSAAAAAGLRRPDRGQSPAAQAAPSAQATPAAPETTRTRRDLQPARDECPACRIASLVIVAQAGPPLALPLPRLAQAAAAPLQRRCWLTLDRACGRAPPRR